MAKRKKSFKQEVIGYAGRKCPSFEPGCPVCDTWEMYDRGAYLYLCAEMIAVNREFNEAGYGPYDFV